MALPHPFVLPFQVRWLVRAARFPAASRVGSALSRCLLLSRFGAASRPHAARVRNRLRVLSGPVWRAAPAGRRLLPASAPAQIPGPSCPPTNRRCGPGREFGPDRRGEGARVLHYPGELLLHKFGVFCPAKQNQLIVNAVQQFRFAPELLVGLDHRDLLHLRPAALNGLVQQAGVPVPPLSVEPRPPLDYQRAHFADAIQIGLSLCFGLISGQPPVVLKEAEVEGFGFFEADVDAVPKPVPAPDSPRAELP